MKLLNAKKIFSALLLTAGVILISYLPAFSAGSDSQSGEESGFNAGKFVIDHVSDAYEWHITSFGDFHVSVPLPVILYSKTSGFHTFMSSKFHHGHDAYNGFMIAHEGSWEGKIVELDPLGNIIGRPWDFSITKTVAGVMVAAILLVFMLIWVAGKARKGVEKAPSGLYNLIEPVVVFIRDEVALPAIGPKSTERFMPFLLTMFFFILFNNLLGLIPIFPFGANVSGNISVTMVLALFTFFVTNLNGNKHYWKEIFNPDVPWWMKFPIPLMPFVEFSGMFTKPFVLMVRLFANMLAGHLIVTVFVSLIFIFTSVLGPAAGWGISPVS
ncbi:MAG TPA: F0F1 ATP synthase subunit A, partial [Prolixibacteraceae bacterium]|nr:F0F1 ATP synthase subunit A [Prolixibacteraceae bacterium]